MIPENLLKHSGFVEVDWGDHELAAWLRKNGWEGGYMSLGNFVSYERESKNPDLPDVLAVVKFKNSQPIDRWVYIAEELL